MKCVQLSKSNTNQAKTHTIAIVDINGYILVIYCLHYFNGIKQKRFINIATSIVNTGLKMRLFNNPLAFYEQSYCLSHAWLHPSSAVFRRASEIQSIWSALPTSLLMECNMQYAAQVNIKTTFSTFAHDAYWHWYNIILWYNWYHSKYSTTYHHDYCRTLWKKTIPAIE